MQLLRTTMFLAQDSASSPAAPRRTLESWNLSDSVQLITIIGLLIAAIVIGGFLLTYLRRKMVAKESAMAGTGSLMEELRRLRKEGTLSEAEYEASRRAATAGLRDSLGKAAPAASSREPARERLPSRPPPRPPIKPVESDTPNGGLQAKPGFDLTGAPLPPHNPSYERKPDNKYD